MFLVLNIAVQTVTAMLYKANESHISVSVVSLVHYTVCNRASFILLKPLPDMHVTQDKEDGTVTRKQAGRQENCGSKPDTDNRCLSFPVYP